MLVKMNMCTVVTRHVKHGEIGRILFENRAKVKKKGIITMMMQLGFPA